MSYDFAGETPEQTIRRAMSILGSIKTKKKARQSRINGRAHKAKRNETERKPAANDTRRATKKS